MDKANDCRHWEPYYLIDQAAQAEVVEGDSKQPGTESNRIQ
jgi:hypothetical protein